MNLLFVCSRNKWRSRTAETIFKNNQHHHVRSAGTEPAARIKVTSKLLKWADIIFVMENKHKQRLFEKFPSLLDNKKIFILDIDDEYKYMDPELIESLVTSVSLYVEGLP
jgi:predicted protein tyrosine phosphatase